MSNFINDFIQLAPTRWFLDFSDNLGIHAVFYADDDGECRLTETALAELLKHPELTPLRNHALHDLVHQAQHNLFMVYTASGSMGGRLNSQNETEALDERSPLDVERYYAIARKARAHSRRAFLVLFEEAGLSLASLEAAIRKPTTRSALQDVLRHPQLPEIHQTRDTASMEILQKADLDPTKIEAAAHAAPTRHALQRLLRGDLAPVNGLH